MHCSPNRSRARVLLLLSAVYFVVFPEDLGAVLTPIERVLALTNSVALGAYVVLAAVVLAWTVVRIWGSQRPVV